MRISDWSSDVCSSDLVATWPDAEKQMAEAQAERDEERRRSEAERSRLREREGRINERVRDLGIQMTARVERSRFNHDVDVLTIRADALFTLLDLAEQGYAAQRETTYRSEEHTSELQSLMRISYAVFCLKKKK